jgi:hypothetical protein
MKAAIASVPRAWLFKKPDWLDHQTAVGLTFAVKTFATALLALYMSPNGQGCKSSSLPDDLLRLLVALDGRLVWRYESNSLASSGFRAVPRAMHR